MKKAVKQAKPTFYKKWWFWFIVIVFVIAVVVSSGTNNPNGTNTSSEPKTKEELLEEKLGFVESITACELYGKRQYSDFKIHSVLGKIAQEVVDDDTWFIKYTVDANGRENLVMECSVTGTTESPQVKNFIVY